MRFVHGVGAEEAAKATASAPRADAAESATTKFEERIQYLEEMVDEITEALVPVLQAYHSRSGDRRRLVALLGELAEVKKQKNDKDWETMFSSREERTRILGSYEQVEGQLNAEIAALSAKLGESES